MLRRGCISVAAFLCAVATLNAWNVVATPKGPNQINLTWGAQPSPLYGYIVEIKSGGDSRYASWTALRPIPDATGYTCNPSLSYGGQIGCAISDPTGQYIYNLPISAVPYWVNEPQYTDPQDDTPAQFIATGLKNNTSYTFRVRTYSGITTPTYGPYSAPATATTANYTVRYISPTGNNDNDGTAPDDAHAWANLGTLAWKGTCGMLLYAKGGNYPNESFNATQGCTAASKLILQAYPGEKPVMTSNLHPSWGPGFVLQGSHIVVDSISINASDASPGDYTLRVTSDHNALLNMNIGPANIPSVYGGVEMLGSHNLIYGSYLHDFGSPDVNQNPSGQGGFPVELSGGGYNVVWSNHITRGGHDCGIVEEGSYNKFLNNIADGGWGMAFETVHDHNNDSSYNLFEGIISRFAGKLEANIYKPGFELSDRNNTVRRSIFTDTGKAIEISALYVYHAQDNAVYNNVFNNVFRCIFQSANGGASAYDGVMVRNNICLFTYDATEIYNNNATPAMYAYNYLRLAGGDGTETPVVWNQNAGGPFENHVSLTFAETNYIPPFAHNAALSLTTLSFVDAAHLDFHLPVGSPLLGAGSTVSDVNFGFPFGSVVDVGAYGLTVPPPTPYPSYPTYRVALGTSANSGVWQADTTYCTGGAAFLTGGLPQPYSSLRYGPSFACNFPVDPGTYTVTLCFAEPNVSHTGQRIFNAAINDAPALTSVDLFALAGLVKPYDVELRNVSAPNGTLKFQFTGLTGNAVVSGIVITKQDLFTGLAVYVSPTITTFVTEYAIPATAHHLHACQTIVGHVYTITAGTYTALEPGSWEIDAATCDVKVKFATVQSNFYVTLIGIP